MKSNVKYYGNYFKEFQKGIFLFNIIEPFHHEVASASIIDANPDDYQKIVDEVEEHKVLWVIQAKHYQEAHDLVSSMRVMKKIDIIVKQPNMMGNHITNAIFNLIYTESNHDRKSLDIFIPIYNESIRSNEVEGFVKKLLSIKAFGFPNVRVHFVDDGSDDNSVTFLEHLAEAYRQHSDTVEADVTFNLLPLDHNTKKSGTYIKAFQMSTSSYILFVDADNAFDLEDIFRCLNTMELGYYDIVIGTKDLQAENRPLVRRFLSACKRMVTRPLLPKGVKDSQTGLKLFKYESMKHMINHLDESYQLAIDLKILNLAKKMDYRVKEIPVAFHEKGNSHIDVVKDSVAFLKVIGKIVLEG